MPLFVPEQACEDGYKLWLRPNRGIECEGDSELALVLDEEIRGLGRANLPGWRERMFPVEGESRYRQGVPGQSELSKQRGIFMSFAERGSSEEHGNIVTKDFLLGKEGERVKRLDKDQEQAIKFHARASKEEIIARLDQFYVGLKRFREKHNLEERRLRAKKARELPYFHCSDTVRALGAHMKVGGRQLADRLERGLPLTGVFCEPGVFDIRKGRNFKRPLGCSTVDELKVLQTELLRGIESSRVVNNDLARELFLKDVEKGLWDGPYTVEESPFTTFLPCPIFSTNSGGKDRLIIDAKRGRINDLVEVWSPIQTDGAEDIIQTCVEVKRALAEAGAECSSLGLCSMDQENAYKSLPVEESAKKVGAAGFFCPVRGRVLIYFTRALFFGAESAVLSYSTFAAFIRAVIRRAAGVPCDNFYDDFVFVVKSGLGAELHILLARIRGEMRIVFGAEKAQWGNSITWCGVQYAINSDFLLKLTISDRRRVALLAQIDSALGSGVIDKAELESLVGRLESLMALVRGRLGRPFVIPLYSKIHARVYNRKTGDRLMRALAWWRNAIAIQNITCEVDLAKTEERRKVVVWTDATRTGRGVVIAVRGGAKAQRYESGWASEDTEICEAELETFVMGLRQLKDSGGRNLSILGLLDNDGSLGILVRGYCKSKSKNHSKLTQLAEEAWTLLCEMQSNIWLERVASGDNPADRPSRLLVKREDSLELKDLKLCSLE